MIESNKNKQTKKQVYRAHSQDEKKLAKTVCEEAQILDLLQKDFKLIFFNMFKKLKEARTIYQQIENINKVIKIIKRNQIENVELKKYKN